MKQCTGKNQFGQAYPFNVTSINVNGESASGTGTAPPSFRWGNEYTVTARFNNPEAKKIIPGSAKFFATYSALLQTFNDEGEACNPSSSLGFNGGCIDRVGTSCTFTPYQGVIPVAAPSATATVGCANGDNGKEIKVLTGDGKTMDFKIKPTPSGGKGKKSGDLTWIALFSNTRTFVKFTDKVNFCVDGYVLFTAGF